MTEPDEQAERPQQTEEQLKLIGEVEAWEIEQPSAS